jgi:hypothetical protein
MIFSEKEKISLAGRPFLKILLHENQFAGALDIIFTSKNA